MCKAVEAGRRAVGDGDVGELWCVCSPGACKSLDMRWVACTIHRKHREWMKQLEV